MLEPYIAHYQNTYGILKPSEANYSYRNTSKYIDGNLFN